MRRIFLLSLLMVCSSLSLASGGGDLPDPDGPKSKPDCVMAVANQKLQVTGGGQKPPLDKPIKRDKDCNKNKPQI